MLFNSNEYLFIFLPLTVIIYFLLNRQRYTKAATAWLVLASLFFYSYWNVKYLALIMMSILINFGVGSAMGKMGKDAPDLRARRAVLLFGILFNLLLLGYYKYADFFISNLNALSGFNLTLQKVILPLGISFFTFTQIAYLVDTYKGTAREYDFLNYSLFVTFFPHLLAGPILHHKEMMPQFASVRNKVVNYRNVSLGLFLFFVGLFKKVIVADDLAPVATAGFDACHVAQPGRGLGHEPLLHPAAVFRLLRVYGHGARRCAAVQHQASGELQFALQGPEHHRLLAALAHDA